MNNYLRMCLIIPLLLSGDFSFSFLTGDFSFFLFCWRNRWLEFNNVFCNQWNWKAELDLTFFYFEKSVSINLETSSAYFVWQHEFPCIIFASESKNIIIYYVLSTLGGFSYILFDLHPLFNNFLYTQYWKLLCITFLSRLYCLDF